MVYVFFLRDNIVHGSCHHSQLLQWILLLPLNSPSLDESKQAPGPQWALVVLMKASSLMVSSTLAGGEWPSKSGQNQSPLLTLGLSSSELLPLSYGHWVWACTWGILLLAAICKEGGGLCESMSLSSSLASFNSILGNYRHNVYISMWDWFVSIIIRLREEVVFASFLWCCNSPPSPIGWVKGWIHWHESVWGLTLWTFIRSNVFMLVDLPF